MKGRLTVSKCRFVIGREQPGQQSEVATLIQQTLEQEKRQRELLEQQYAQYDADDDEVMTTIGIIQCLDRRVGVTRYRGGDGCKKSFNTPPKNAL